MGSSKSRPLPQIIKDEIIKDIMIGEIQPRDKILEEKYAKRMNASRASVREAIFMLVNDGIATRVENKGTFLNSFSIEENIDLYNLRFFLEKQALNKLEKIEDLTPLIETLENLSLQMRKDVDCVNKLSYLNYEFHYALVRFSNSRVLIERYPSFFVGIAFIQNDLYRRNRDEIEKPISEHDELISTLRNRDFTGFITILEAHHRDLIGLLKKMHQ